MSVELKIPSFGESITDVVLGEWLKGPGDTVAMDDPLVVIETDKVTAELPAPVSGTVTKILKRQGETCLVGEVIGYMEEGQAPTAPGGGSEDEGVAAQAAEPRPRETGVAAQAAEPRPRETGVAAQAAEPRTGDETSTEAAPATEPPRVMPAAARVLAERGLTPSEVQPTGPGGRLLKEDVERHVPAAAESPAGPRHTETVPMTPMRRRIAERLVQSQQNAALLTTFNEIDMSAVIDLRKRYKESFLERHGVKLGFMSFFVKAAVEALKQIPEFNARIDGENIVYHNYVDMGVAIGGGRGLVVPILRNAERLSFAEIEERIADFAERAQTGKLQIEELQGGTFTISNGGVYGSLLSTPIINPPQTGILGLHAIENRPVAEGEQVVVRPMMYVAVTYDHRLVDGREAVTFLKRIKECIETPSRILLEI